HHTGLAEWIGGYFAIMGGWPIILVIFVIVSVILIFTELASNSATAAAFLPIMGSVAIGVGQNPLLLAIPVAIVASCAFMLPVATPPNAIVYGSGVMTIPQMAKAGMILNLFFAMLVTVLTYFLFTAILGIEIGVVPDGLMP
ncbi:MAG: anion permease, partial [Balneolales bacterium]